MDLNGFVGVNENLILLCCHVAELMLPTQPPLPIPPNCILMLWKRWWMTRHL